MIFHVFKFYDVYLLCIYKELMCNTIKMCIFKELAESLGSARVNFSF